MIITTSHGTKFRIDLENKTWERIDKTGDSGNLRDESGTFLGDNVPVIGEGYRMVCPPKIEGALCRLIITSPVAAIEV